MTDTHQGHLQPELVRRIGGAAAVIMAGVVLVSPIRGMPPDAQRLAALTVMMVILWVTQALPIPVTSLLPLALYPLLGIRAISDVSRSYLDPSVFLFMGGFMIAIGIEKWDLHRRMALKIVGAIGFGPRRVVFGFMAATAFLSMWISNTASTMLMLPIGLALVSAIASELGLSHESAPQAGATPGLSRLSRSLLLGIAYGASIGGLSTPIGTPTNIAFLRFWNENTLFAGAPETATAEWMSVFLPLSVAMLVVTGFLLTWKMPPLAGAQQLGRRFFRDRLEDLGPPSRQEVSVFCIFLATAALWILRKPLSLGETTLVPGWGPVLTTWLTDSLGVSEHVAGGAAHDAVVAMSMAILMFCLPAGRDATGQPRRLMDWETVESRMPWGMLLLIGGGFAVAEAFDSTGLSQWVGTGFQESFRDARLLWLIVGICLLSTFLTEMTTNVVLVNTLLPILAAAAISLRLDPRLLLIPATVSASCAFMLPIATPPNVIVFSTGRLSMRDMMRVGLILNLVGVVLVTTATFTLLVPGFEISLDAPPDWLPPANALPDSGQLFEQ